MHQAVYKIPDLVRGLVHKFLQLLINCQAKVCLPEAVVYVMTLLSGPNISCAEHIVLKGIQPLLCNLCPDLTTRAPDFLL